MRVIIKNILEVTDRKACHRGLGGLRSSHESRQVLVAPARSVIEKLMNIGIVPRASYRVIHVELIIRRRRKSCDFRKPICLAALQTLIGPLRAVVIQFVDLLAKSGQSGE